ncbi:MAG: M48 family metallopeptidase [Phycisphaerales bacterium]
MTILNSIPEFDIPVIYNNSRRARRLTISIKPFKPVRITFPSRVGQKKAQEFFEKNIDWVKKAVAKIRDIEKQTPQKINLPRINRSAAKTFLAGQLKAWAQTYDFSYNKVYIRNQRTRWGSCSGTNNISLNINIVRLPKELQDYILLHELVHTRIKNHSRKFWNELDKYVPNSKSVAKKLRQHSLNLLHYAA